MLNDMVNQLEVDDLIDKISNEYPSLAESINLTNTDSGIYSNFLYLLHKLLTDKDSHK